MPGFAHLDDAQRRAVIRYISSPEPAPDDLFETAWNGTVFGISAPGARRLTFMPTEDCGDLRDLIGRPHSEHATITVGPSDVVTTAHNRLRNAGFSQLPVMDEGKLVGVITEDAIIQHVFGKPELMNAPVGEAMESAFIKLDKTTTVNNLVAMLHVQPYAAIMDGDEFLGLITRSDVLNYLRRQI